MKEKKCVCSKISWKSSLAAKHLLEWITFQSYVIPFKLNISKNFFRFFLLICTRRLHEYMKITVCQLRATKKYDEGGGVSTFTEDLFFSFILSL